MSTAVLWNSSKTVALTGDQRHRHKGKAVAPNFVAPNLAPSISFTPLALAAAIARTATLRPAPPALLAHLGHGAFAEAQILLADGPKFELSPLVEFLADSERTHFASRVGAGITDLYMNALGYSWRDNAVCLTKALDPHADFIYAGGTALAHGVVLAEARGSFAQKTSDAAMRRSAANKYLRQVRPYIGATSPHGPVIHGYALAFGAKPGASGAFLRLSQTLRAKPRGGGPWVPLNAPAPPRSPAQVPVTLALATNRSNFTLMDALPVANWIDWISGTRDAPEEGGPVTFVRFNYARRSFLVSLDAFAPYRWPYLGLDDLDNDTLWGKRWRRPRAPFVMEEKAAVSFLNALTGLIRRGPRDLREAGETFELPIGDIAAFGLGEAAAEGSAARDGYDYALFRDGLALVAAPPRHGSWELRRWHPRSGFEG
jgi:hypothetical protein